MRKTGHENHVLPLRCLSSTSMMRFVSIANLVEGVGWCWSSVLSVLRWRETYEEQNMRPLSRQEARNLKGFEDFRPKAHNRISPCLSYMCHVATFCP